MADRIQSVEYRKENVRHILEDHDDHRALLRMLARRFGVTEAELRDECLAEIETFTARER